VLKGHRSYVYPVAFSPDDSLIVSGGWDHMIRLWDAGTLEEIAELEGHDDYVVHLLFSGDGWHLLSLGNDGLRFWELSTRRPLNHLRENVNICYGIQTEPPLVAMWEAPDDLRAWDPLSGRVGPLSTAALSSFASPFISPDGDVFVARDAAADARVFSLFRVADGAALPGFRFSQVCAFSPSGDRIAARDAVHASLVHVWDGRTAAQLGTLRGHAAKCLTFNTIPTLRD